MSSERVSVAHLACVQNEGLWREGGQPCHSCLGLKGSACPSVRPHHQSAPAEETGPRYTRTENSPEGGWTWSNPGSATGPMCDFGQLSQFLWASGVSWKREIIRIYVIESLTKNPGDNFLGNRIPACCRDSLSGRGELSGVPHHVVRTKSSINTVK